MATNNRAVELSLRVNTEGGDKVEQLTDNLKDLSQAGAGAAPSFEHLAAELDAAATKTTELRAAENAARAELAKAKEARQQQAEALERYRIESDKATKATADYIAKEKTLLLALLDSKAGIRDKQKALDSAAISSKAAAAAEKTLTDQVKALQSANQQHGREALASAVKQEAANTTVAGSLKGIGDQLRTVQSLAGAAIGGQLLGGLVGDITKTADAYSDLAGKIKLVTGEGAAFDMAFNGVFEVATRTNTAVEQTGTLFARIAEAGKLLGVSQNDALRLTESINQAVQISGASADSSNAAITQLIQGLQSGVLRGDEFNSVMEQSPRLAKALADGLGVTTGELRKLAEAGSLTAATVISSLQGQSTALQTEFDKLPPTVGRAIQSLSNSWTQYVGEVDKANGISAAAALVITTLAQNLDTLGNVLYSAGKAAAAYQALKLAQTFLGIGTAARTAAAEVTALTAAQTASTASSGAAAAGAGRFAAVLGAFKVTALVAVLVNLKEIGTAIGEGVAKWAGYGKAIEAAEKAAKAEEEATRANAASKAELAQRLQLASDKALGLTDASRKLVGEFDEVVTKGGSVSAAIEKVSKALELKDISGIATAGAALDALAVKGKASAFDIQTAYSSALKGIDLGVFATEARAAFDSSEQGARRLQAALDAVASESLVRAGTGINELKTGFSAASSAAINDVDAVAKTLINLGIKGTDAGRALSVSLNKATDAATTERAVKAVIERLEQLGKQGLITGDLLTLGLQKAKDKLDQIVPGVNNLEEALRKFGLKSQAELQQTADTFKGAWEQIRTSTTVSLSDQIKAFEQYKAASVAANKGVVSSEIKLQEEILRMRLSATDTSESIIKGVDRETASRDRNLQSIQRQTDAIKKQKTTSDGFEANADGSAKGTFTNNLPVDTAFRVNAKSAAGTLTAADLPEAQAGFEQAKNAKTDMDAFLKLSPGAASTEYIQSTNALFIAAKLALEKVQAMISGQIGTTPKNQPGAPAPALAPQKSVTVNINLGGKTTAVNVVSDGDANNLVGLLRALENDAARAQ